MEEAMREAWDLPSGSQIKAAYVGQPFNAHLFMERDKGEPCSGWG
jgi:hypothetical protein